MLSPKKISAISAAAIIFIEISAVIGVAYTTFCRQNIILAIFIIMIASILIPYISNKCKALLLKTAGLFQNRTIFANDYRECSIMRLNVDGAYYKDNKLYIETHISGSSVSLNVPAKDTFLDDYQAAAFLYEFIDCQLDRAENLIQTKFSEEGRESVRKIMFGEYVKPYGSKTTPPEINMEEFVKYLSNKIYTEEAAKASTELIVKKYC